MAARRRARPRPTIGYEEDSAQDDTKSKFFPPTTRTLRSKAGTPVGGGDGNGRGPPAPVDDVATGATVGVLGRRIKKEPAVKSESPPADDAEQTEDPAQPRKRIKVKVDGPTSTPTSQAKAKKAKAPGGGAAANGKERKVAQPGNDHWREMLENIRAMRTERNAAVDIHGCEVLSDPAADEPTRRFHTLVALLLSSQTKDEVTSAAVSRLKVHGLTVDNIVATSEAELGKLIHPVGFWRRKSEYLAKSARILQNQYGGDIPNTAEGLMSLPGVGPKMAYIAMNVAWGQVTGLGVDTHVHRTTNRMGWVKTKDPEGTRLALQDWLPYEHWQEFNVLVVGFGQQLCRPIAPKCSECLNRHLCPWARNSSNRSKMFKPKAEGALHAAPSKQDSE